MMQCDEKLLTGGLLFGKEKHFNHKGELTWEENFKMCGEEKLVD